MNSLSTLPKQNLLNEMQVAEVLAVTISAVRGWRLRGGGPRYIKIGKLVRYRPADLDAYIESRVFDHTSQRGGAE
jgi:hypothetical protein